MIWTRFSRLAASASVSSSFRIAAITRSQKQTHASMSIQWLSQIRNRSVPWAENPKLAIFITFAGSSRNKLRENVNSNGLYQ